MNINLYKLIPTSLKIKFRKRFNVCNPVDSLVRLKSYGISADIVINAGAYDGISTLKMFPIFPFAKWLLIEPQKNMIPLIHKNLDGKNIDYIVSEDLLYSKDGVLLDFHIVDSGNIKTGSSIYKEKNANTSVTKIKSKTLDTICKDNKIIGFNTLLKMDILGAELDCLKGASELLKTVTAILLEINILDFNEGSPQFREIDRFLENKGFRIFDIAEIHRLEDGKLNQIDLVYIPTDNSIFKL